MDFPIDCGLIVVRLLARILSRSLRLEGILTKCSEEVRSMHKRGNEANKQYSGVPRGPKSNSEHVNNNMDWTTQMDWTITICKSISDSNNVMWNALN